VIGNSFAKNVQNVAVLDPIDPETLHFPQQNRPENCSSSCAISKPSLGGETSMKQLLLRLHRDESGQDLIEYALVAALIAFAAVAAMQTLASQINNAFSTIGSKLTSAL